MIPIFAKTLTAFSPRDIDVENTDARNSITICCRCTTVKALVGVKQLIDSGEMSNHFSLIMSYLTSEPVTASVSRPMSLEDFKEYLNSLTGDPG